MNNLQELILPTRGLTFQGAAGVLDQPATGRPPGRRLRPGRWLASFAAAACILAGLNGVAAAADLTGTYSGVAFGVNADTKVGPLQVGLTKLAYLGCPCAGTKGVLKTSSLASVNVGSGFVASGVMRSTGITNKTFATATGTLTNEIAGLSVAGGLITADALTSVATVSADPTTVTVNADGTQFVNLIVAGNPVAVNVAPNTVLSVAGLGTVTLRKTVFGGDGKKAKYLTVTMISIKVGVNALGLGIGSVIDIGSASIGFNRTVINGLVQGQAYAVDANAAIGSTLQATLSKQAYVSMPCYGTDGLTRTNAIVTVNAPGVLTLAGGRTTAVGGRAGVGGLGSTAKTTATVDSVSLLGSVLGIDVLKATNIVAAVQEVYDNGVRTASAAGSKFGSIAILGIPISLNLPPNTTLGIAGFGTVIINEQVLRKTPTGSTPSYVNGLRVKITLANVLGLPIGTEITVAHADAGASPP